MIRYEFVLPPVLSLIAGGCLGYILGLHEATLIDKIRTLQGQEREVQKPTITMGDYKPPKEISDNKEKSVGIVEAKTPQRVAWEQENAIEKEALQR